VSVKWPRKTVEFQIVENLRMPTRNGAVARLACPRNMTDIMCKAQTLQRTVICRNRAQLTAHGKSINAQQPQRIDRVVCRGDFRRLGRSLGYWRKCGNRIGNTLEFKLEKDVQICASFTKLCDFSASNKKREKEKRVARDNVQGTTSLDSRNTFF
jgi:hypothetical protein